MLPIPDYAKGLALERLRYEIVAPELLFLVFPQGIQAFGVREEARHREFSERGGENTARGRYYYVRVLQVCTGGDLTGSGHAPLNPAKLRRHPCQVFRVAAGEVEEYLRFSEHPEELFLLFRRAPPVRRSSVAPTPPGRRYQILPVEYLQPPGGLTDPPDIFFFEKARNDHRSHVYLPRLRILI